MSVSSVQHTKPLHQLKHTNETDSFNCTCILCVSICSMSKFATTGSCHHEIHHQVINGKLLHMSPSPYNSLRFKRNSFSRKMKHTNLATIRQFDVLLLFILAFRLLVTKFWCTNHFQKYRTFWVRVISFWVMNNSVVAVRLNTRCCCFKCRNRMLLNWLLYNLWILKNENHLIFGVPFRCVIVCLRRISPPN